MSGDMWVVRAGEKARYVNEFLDGSFIAVNFTDFAPDDLRLADESSLKARAQSPAETAYARQLVSFAYRLDLGDLVIVPRLIKGHRDYLVARIVGTYEHTPNTSESGPHRRQVEWLGRFLRDDMSEAAANTMRSLSTVFRPTAVEAEFRGLLTALAPLADGPPAATGSQPSLVPAPSAQASPAAAVTSKPDEAHRPVSVAQLDIDVDERGRARITCPYPALVMEQTPRNVDPGRDWAGVPGIYVLTGTELQQSSTRTGHERTLTTTLIVRPWAYVGLSEDFFGRLTSHRQIKPEWRRALLVRSGGQPFSSDDIKYLEERVHAVLADTDEVALDQSKPRGNLSARPRNPALLDACANSVVAVLRLTGTLI